MVTQLIAPKSFETVVTWEPLPDDFKLKDDPVENTGHPLLAGALREILEIAGYILPTMLIASNFAVCATLNSEFVAKAPDWVFVDRVNQVLGSRKSYTPNLEGNTPAVVMEFLSNDNIETNMKGDEYSAKPTYPPGKWFFYEQILQVPVYVVFEPEAGLLEFYKLENGRYNLEMPDENGRHWIASMGLFLGTWRGSKEGRTGYWLRWWDSSGNLLPWAVEKLEQERQQKQRLADYLRSQGIDPDNLPEI